MTSTTAPAKKAPAKISAGGVKKIKNEGLKVITANDLFSGAVVYWTASKSWTEDLREAQIVEGAIALEELARATADEARSVGPYLMDVDAESKPSGRFRLREEIRDWGPTTHPEFTRTTRRKVA